MKGSHALMPCDHLRPEDRIMSLPKSGRLWLFAVLLLAITTALHCSSRKNLATAEPEDAGVGSGEVAELLNFMQDLVDDGKIAGGVTMMARHGKVIHLHAVGMADREAGKPMRTDSIYRLASMTKPTTSVAIMILYDKGRISLDDPLSKYIPSFKDMRVMVGGNPDNTEPARSEITIHQLLTHTAGFESYIDSSPLYEQYRKAGLYGVLHGSPNTLAETIPRLSDFPLVYHPGEEYLYSLSPDILGYVVEVVSEMPFDRFLEMELFEPLGMVNTHFFLPKEKVGRLAAVYERTKTGKLLRMQDGVVFRIIDRRDLDEKFVFPLTYRIDFPYAGPKKYLSGAGGLCSTPTDFMRFCLMLANRGQLNGRRILKEDTVDLMTKNQIGDFCLPTYHENENFGYGFLVVDRPDDPFSGAYHWSGAYGTIFWIHPRTRSVLLVMTQCSQSSQVNVIDLLAPTRRLAEMLLVN